MNSICKKMILFWPKVLPNGLLIGGDRLAVKSSVGLLTNQPNSTNFSTSNSNMTKTMWAQYWKVPKNMPRVHLPDYLLDREITRNQGKGGRGIDGKIQTHHIGGGHTRNLRITDYMRVAYNPSIPAKDQKIYTDTVIDICYDPNRRAYLAKVIGTYSDSYRLVVSAEGIQKGDTYQISRGPPLAMSVFKLGDTFPLKYFPIGSKVFNIEKFPGSGGMFCRSAGMCFTISNIFSIEGKVNVELGHIHKKVKHTLNGDCLASFGQASNSNHSKLIIGKAGRSHNMNHRSKGKVGLKRHIHHRRRETKNERLQRLKSFTFHVRSFKRKIKDETDI